MRRSTETSGDRMRLRHPKPSRPQPRLAFGALKLRGWDHHPGKAPASRRWNQTTCLRNSCSLQFRFLAARLFRKWRRHLGCSRNFLLLAMAPRLREVGQACYACRLGGTTSEQPLGDKATEQRTRANSTRHDLFASMPRNFPSEELRLQIRRNDLRTGHRTMRT